MLHSANNPSKKNSQKCKKSSMYIENAFFVYNTKMIDNLSMKPMNSPYSIRFYLWILTTPFTLYSGEESGLHLP